MRGAFWVVVCVASVVLSAACGDAAHPDAADLESGAWGTSSLPLADAGPAAQVESCEVEGAQLACGKVTEVHGDYVYCSDGYRTCQGGQWGPCRGTRFVTAPASGVEH